MFDKRRFQKYAINPTIILARWITQLIVKLQNVPW